MDLHVFAGQRWLQCFIILDNISQLSAVVQSLNQKVDMLSDIWLTLLYTGCTFNLCQFRVALLPVPNVYPCFEGLHYSLLPIYFCSTSSFFFFAFTLSQEDYILYKRGEDLHRCIYALQNTFINIKHACYFDYIFWWNEMMKVKFHRKCIIWLLCSA